MSKTCEKCGGAVVFKEEDSWSMNGSDCMLCSKLHSCARYFRADAKKINKMAMYVYYDSIEEKGMKWYKEARGKILAHLDKLKKQEQDKKRLSNDKLAKEIMKL